MKNDRTDSTAYVAWMAIITLTQICLAICYIIDLPVVITLEGEWWYAYVFMGVLEILYLALYLMFSSRLNQELPGSVEDVFYKYGMLQTLFFLALVATMIWL